MRIRRVLLVISILAVLGGVGYLAYWQFVLRPSWAGHEAENPDEMQRLATAEFGVPPVAGATAGWPNWRGPTRDGRAPAGPLRTDWDENAPKRLWKSECGGGYSSFAVTNGKVYTQDRKGDNERVICLDAATGALDWEFAYPADYRRMGYPTGPRATPSIDGNRLYAVGALGRFLCLELPTPGGQPKLLWEHDLIEEFRASVPQWGVACSPLVDGDQVIVQPGGSKGSVAAFDKQDGALRWNAGDAPSGYSSPVAATIGDLRLILAMTGTALLCVRASDGKVLDEYRWTTQHNGNIATPVVVKDYVFISSSYNKGCATLRVKVDGDRANLVEVYSRNNRVMRNHHSTCVFLDGFLYGFDDRHLHCVDFRKGTQKEDWKADGVEKGSVILAGRHLVILSENGELAVVEATPVKFHLVALIRSGLGGSQTWALPVLVDGRLYIRDGQQVICFEVRPAK